MLSNSLFKITNNSYFANKLDSTDDYTLWQAAIYFSSSNNDIANLINAVSLFRSQTAPEFQTQRDNSIKTKEISSILNTLGEALKTYQEYLNQNSGDKEAADALDFSTKAIHATLKQLKSSKDKIYRYYSRHDNLLKTQLPEQTQVVGNRPKK